MKNINKISLCLILIFCFFYLSTDVYAHKASTYAYREGDKIFGECYFVSGSPCKNSKVEIYDLKGNKILETKTDDKGKYSFTTTEKGDLRIIISAGEGHKAEYKLQRIVEKTQNKEIKKQTQLTQAHDSINKDEIKKLIEEAMDTKLQGLKTEIMDLRKQMDRVYLRDIIGGLGYIFGIWGIIMFLKREKNAS